MDKTKFPLSVCIIAKNEEARLTGAIESVAWVDDIVVVDDESTDKTAQIAAAMGARVIRRAMDIEGRHRNFAYSQAKNDWVLSLDADERVSPELAEAIKDALSHERVNGHEAVNAYAIPIKTFIGNRWIRGGGYYPAPKVRLFRKEKFRYEEARVHPRIFLEGRSETLAGDILHYSSRNFGEFVSKLNRETELEADKWIRDGRRVSLAGILRKTIDRFLKNYFLKRGWQDGFPGFLMSYFHSLYQLLSYAKYWEKTRDKNRLH